MSPCSCDVILNDCKMPGIKLALLAPPELQKSLQDVDERLSEIHLELDVRILSSPMISVPLTSHRTF